MPRIIKFLKYCVTVIILILIVMKLLRTSFIPEMKYRKLDTMINLPFVIVHLDLKGAPPKLSYLESLLSLLKENGANGLLIEYEDMFPFEGNLANVSSKNCYKKDELRRFLTIAVKSGFEIIPLIQTFGHMEYVLKTKPFEHLREDPTFSDSICPSKLESQRLLTTQLKQIIDFHRNIFPMKYIHIGCDEVSHISVCEKCKHIKPEYIFIDHVITISSIIKTRYPETTVLIWDDMLLKIKSVYFNLTRLGSYVEPVSWHYRTNVAVSHPIMYQYYLHFNNMWIASAFKGADGENSLVPNLWKRYRNHYSWMKTIQGYNFGRNHPVSFKGIFLTGWSRYNHLAPLCDLLATSIPSLVLNLLLIKECNNNPNISIILETQNYKQFYESNISEKFQKALNCTTTVDFPKMSHCSYREHKLYNLSHYYLNKCFRRNCNNIKFNLDKKSAANIEYYFGNELKSYYNDIVVEEIMSSNWITHTNIHTSQSLKVLPPG